MTTGRRWVFLSAVTSLLLLVWRFSPVPSPPLYDGVQLPNEPYRYLQAPAGPHSTKHPTSARLQTSLSIGSSPAVFVQTAEQPAQARLDLNGGAFRVAQPARLVLSIHPVPPVAESPDGRFDGNIYRFVATSSPSTPLHLKAGAIQISLRGTGLSGSPIIEQYVAGRWERHPTIYYQSTDYFVTHASTLGDFALVFARGASAKQGENNTILLLVFVFSVVGTVLVAVIFIIREVRRTRARMARSRRR